MADLTPIPMGIPWDPCDPSLPHSHAHLYSGACFVTQSERQRRACGLDGRRGHRFIVKSLFQWIDGHGSGTAEREGGSEGG